MNPRTIAAAVALLLAAGGAHAQKSVPSDHAIRKILVERIDAQKQGVGIVVGIIGPSGPRVIAAGTRSVGEQTPVDADTVFEIGSVTKVFTALLLAEAVNRGEVSLDDPAQKFLPPGVKMPRFGEREIRMIDLATHTSGLPRLPANLDPNDMRNPYAGYTTEKLYEFLSTFELPREPGSRYEYSNLGAGLLGHLLARRAGVDYETLLRDRITRVLGMKSTTITLSPELQKRLALGHNGERQTTPNWDLAALAGAGALRSSVSDLLTFLHATLGYRKTRIRQPVEAMLAVRRETASPNVNVALGWHVLKTPAGREIVLHDGGTGGYRSFVGFDPKRRIGIVILANMFTDVGVNDIGLHLFDQTSPLYEPPKVRTAISLAPDVLDRYTGRYSTDRDTMTITRDGETLLLQRTGAPKMRLFAESSDKFFSKVIKAEVMFTLDSSGKPTSVTIVRDGEEVVAKRVD